jgi:hypothetical protein
VLSSPARMIVNNTPRRTSRPPRAEECDVRIRHIARDATVRKEEGEVKNRSEKSPFAAGSSHTFVAAVLLQ